jgi:flavin reductase (DIM6/NTAB) family NADH-FMN oxidoreductase RutF
MEKIAVAPQCLIPVRPILIVGANIGGKPNFFEVGAGGLVSTDPPMVALPIRHQRYTLKSILENRTFSVNIPPVELVKESDYCGMVSGKKTDKVKDCNFHIFYGSLTTAPMIEECPINMECSLMHILGSNSHLIVVGRVDGTYLSQEFTKDNKPILDELKPLLWFPEMADYVMASKVVGKCRGAGNALKHR